MKTRFGYIGLIFCMLLLLVQQAHARLIEKEPKDPNWIGNYDLTSSDGTEFWAAFMTHNGISENDPTLKLSIHAIADTTATIVIEVNGIERGRIELTEDASGFVQEGVFQFQFGDGLAWNDVYLPSKDAETPQNRGVHIYSLDHKTSFSCYAQSEAGTGQGTTRATSILLPAHMLGMQYYVQTFQTDINATEFAVVATDDNTHVTITTPISTSKTRGTEQTTTLRKGQVYMVRSKFPEDVVGDASINLSGSLVCADKPVAVFQGNDYVKIAPGSTGSYSGNHAFNQAFPIEQLGTTYHINLAEQTKYNFYNILATEDGTVVTATGNGSVTLNAGETLPTAFRMSASGDKFVKVTANHPIMVTHYLTCGGANQEETATSINNWGNPTSATMVPWERRTKKKSFYTQPIPNETDEGICKMYVQVATSASQTGTFKLDGVNVPASSFVRSTADQAIAIANIEVTTAGKHTMETTGGGFVGFVYAVQSEARAYEYTMGFSPKPLFDSLYVTETDNIMSQKKLNDDILSYNLERTSRGWYQRQLGEWLQPRLDTAVVCDSTEVHWALYTPSEKPIEQLEWSIYNVTDGKKATSSTKITDDDTPYTEPQPDANTQHNYSYKFILPEEPINNRHPFFEYEIQAVLKRTLEKCDIEELDTFRTVVRVTRMYNDTTWKVVCKGDVFTFFNDTTTTGERKEYTTTFYFESTPAIDELPDYQKHQYHLGENIITRRYISQGGCDSLSTLRFYVCDTKNETLDTTICEDGLLDLKSRLGYFFNNINFVNSFKNKTSDSRWKRQTDGSWVFEDKSSIKTTSCKDEVTEYIEHKAKYDGCDSTLNLQLRVMPVDVRSKSINICEGSYEWRDDDGNLIQTIVRTAGENYNTPHPYTYSIKYQNCVGCPTDGCDSVRYELKLMFVDAAGSDTVHLCQNADPVAYVHKDDNTGASYTWPTFDPRGKNVGIYSYESQKHLFESPGCNYYFHPVFVVDTVLTYRDSVVYCYEEGKTVYHTWENHGRFWYNKKGETRKQTAASITVDLSTIRTRTIYELTDTIWTPGECPTVYNQAVIFMPNYNSSSRHDMSDEDVYEWDNKLLAGDKATGYDNPKGLDVIVMRPTGASYPTKWTVTYDASLKQYTIVNATQTVAIKNEQGQAQSCDSTATLYLRIGQKFDSTEYAPTCSDAKTYKWRQKDIAVPQGITAPTTITKYDSLKTKHPVVGLDSVYILQLTVYPAFRDTTAETEVCQRRHGYQWAGHMGEGHTLYDGAWNPIDSICIDNVGHYYFIDKMDTKPRSFTDPGTGVSTPVTCDSIWVLDLTVHTVYDSTFTMIGGDTIVLKSNDTVTYFEPKTLFIGEDFDYAAHGGKTAAQLAAETGADKWEIVRKDSMYSKLSTSQYGCDSTTYKFIELCRLQRVNLPPMVIGDNDTTWTFGGDTTPDEYGVREHTQPLVTGWDFHVDDYGRAIDYTTDGRPVRTREYIDTLHTVDGCDSIVHVSLTIYPSYRYDTAATICHNQPYSWRGLNDLNMLGTDSVTSTVYVPKVYKTVQSGGLVDSTYVLALTIRPGQLRYYSKNICYNETFLFYSIPVTYDPEMSMDTVVAVFQPDGGESCGDKFILYPTFKPAYGYAEDPNYKAFVDSADVCQYDDFHWYDKDGKEHTVNLRDADGRKYTQIPTDRRGWHTIYDSLKTVSCNCDSIYTLHYFVDTTYRYVTDTAICPEALEDFRWIVLDKNGNPYAKDTIYSSDATVPIHIYDTIAGKTVHGCDSSFYLDLFVDQPYELNFDTTLCSDIDHYEWTGDNGTVVYDPWIELASDTFGAQHFFDTLHTQTVRGKCDSVVYLHLIIAPRKDSVWQDTICTGETYYLYDQPITAGGNYEIVRINEFGCESKYILELTEVPPTVINLTVEPVCVDEDGMANNYVIRYTYEGDYAPITYSIRYDSIAEELGFESEEDVLITEEAQLLLPVPEFGTRDKYPRPGYYEAVIAFQNGVCMTDSLMTYPFTLEMRYPSWLTAQHWNDAILIVDSALNGGYIFSAYQWYRNDSILHGETKPYLYEPQYLHAGAQYSVALTRKDDAVTVRTCPIIPDLSNWYDKSPQQNYVSVVPTVVAKENPIVYILSTSGGIYKLMNTQGQLITQGTYTPDDKNTYPVTLPAISGVYVFHLIDNATTGTGGDLSRTVKVMVQ